MTILAWQRSHRKSIAGIRWLKISLLPRAAAKWRSRLAVAPSAVVIRTFSRLVPRPVFATTESHSYRPAAKQYKESPRWIFTNLTRELKVQNDSKIVMLVADGLGGLPLEPGGQTELETAQHPQSGRPGPTRRLRAAASRSPGHHARQRTGTPGPVRLRSAEVPDRPRGAGGHRHRLQAGTERRGHPLQLLHARRRRQHHRPPRRPHPQRGERPAGRQAPRGEDSRRRGVRRAGQGASLRGRLPRRRAWAATWPTPIRKRTGVPPLDPVAHDAGQPADGRGRHASSSPRRKSCWPASRRPTG